MVIRKQKELLALQIDHLYSNKRKQAISSAIKTRSGRAQKQQSGPTRRWAMSGKMTKLQATINLTSPIRCMEPPKGIPTPNSVERRRVQVNSRHLLMPIKNKNLKPKNLTLDFQIQAFHWKKYHSQTWKDTSSCPIDTTTCSKNTWRQKKITTL